MKVEQGEGPAIVFNEGSRSMAEKSNADFAKLTQSLSLGIFHPDGNHIKSSYYINEGRTEV